MNPSQQKQFFQSVSLELHPENSLICNFSWEDYCSLLPQQWLRTEAVNLVSNLLYEIFVKHFEKVLANEPQQPPAREQVRLMDVYLSTMIMTADESILATLENVGIFAESTQYWLIPINTDSKTGSHWILLLLSRSEIIVFDSSSTDLSTVHTFSSQLKRMHELFKQTSITLTVRSFPNTPKQGNTYDCGVFTAAFCEFVLLEIVDALQSNRAPAFDSFAGRKYLFGNSEMARKRYREMVEQTLKGFLPANFTGANN